MSYPGTAFQLGQDIRKKNAYLVYTMSHVILIGTVNLAVNILLQIAYNIKVIF